MDEGGGGCLFVFSLFVTRRLIRLWTVGLSSTTFGFLHSPGDLIRSKNVESSISERQLFHLGASEN